MGSVPKSVEEEPHSANSPTKNEQSRLSKSGRIPNEAGSKDDIASPTIQKKMPFGFQKLCAVDNTSDQG
jgi:hypothetical protein